MVFLWFSVDLFCCAVLCCVGQSSRLKSGSASIPGLHVDVMAPRTHETDHSLYLRLTIAFELEKNILERHKYSESEKVALLDKHHH